MIVIAGWLLHRAGPKSLERPEGDEGGHAPRNPAQDRAEDEQADADQHDRLGPIKVGELGEDRHRHRLRQQVDGEARQGNWAKPPRSLTIDGTAVARMVASIAISPTLSITNRHQNRSAFGPEDLDAREIVCSVDWAMFSP